MRLRKRNLAPAPALAAGLTVLLSLGAAHAATDSAPGFDPTTIAAFVDRQKASGTVALPALTKEQAERRDLLHVLAYRFRRVALADPQLLMAGFAQFDPRVLLDILTSRAALEAPDIWRYFFHGALVHVGHVAARVSRIGFYNPHVDGWVMTDWRWEGRDPLLVGAYVASGAAVRAEPIEAAWPIAWGRPERAPAAMHGVVGLSAFAFAKAHPIAAINPPPSTAIGAERVGQREMIELRLLAGLRNLAKHREAPGFAKTTEALLAAVRAGDATALKRLANGAGAQAAHRVAGLPIFVRARLELTGLYPTPSGAILAFAAPMMPRWMVMALYRHGTPAGAIAIDDLAVVDLSPPAEGQGS